MDKRRLYWFNIVILTNKLVTFGVKVRHLLHSTQVAKLYSETELQMAYLIRNLLEIDKYEFVQVYIDLSIKL